MPSPLETDSRKGLSSIKSDVIVKIETFRVPPRWLFVRVETASGLVGWGEATLEGHSEAVEGAFEDFRERFIGWEAGNIEDIYQSAYRHRFYRGGPVLMSALAGLDIALWDIKGKTLGVPVWELLGGKVREKVAVYGWIGGDRPTDVLEQAKDRKAQGFTAVKMNAVESLGWLDSPDALKPTVERLKEVRSVGIDVGLDFHGRIHKTLSKQLARLLEPYQPLFIEEPLLPGHVEELKKLYQQTTIPIAVSYKGQIVCLNTNFSSENDCLLGKMCALILKLVALTSFNLISHILEESQKQSALQLWQRPMM